MRPKPKLIFNFVVFSPARKINPSNPHQILKEKVSIWLSDLLKFPGKSFKKIQFHSRSGSGKSTRAQGLIQFTFRINFPKEFREFAYRGLWTVAKRNHCAKSRRHQQGRAFEICHHSIQKLLLSCLVSLAKLFIRMTRTQKHFYVSICDDSEKLN